MLAAVRTLCFAFGVISVLTPNAAAFQDAESVQASVAAFERICRPVVEGGVEFSEAAIASGLEFENSDADQVRQVSIFWDGEHQAYASQPSNMPTDCSVMSWTSAVENVRLNLQSFLGSVSCSGLARVQTDDAADILYACNNGALHVRVFGSDEEFVTVVRYSANR